MKTLYKVLITDTSGYVTIASNVTEKEIGYIENDLEVEEWEIIEAIEEEREI